MLARRPATGGAIDFNGKPLAAGVSGGVQQPAIAVFRSTKAMKSFLFETLALCVGAPITVTGKAITVTGAAVIKVGEATVRTGLETTAKGEQLEAQWKADAAATREAAAEAALEALRHRTTEKLSKARAQEAAALDFARANGLIVDVTPVASVVGAQMPSGAFAS